MKPRRAPFLALLVALSLTTAGCIAETKFAPAPTVEYLPCSGLDLTAPRVDPETLSFDPDMWGGFWRTGDEWHIGLTDPGAVDLREVCRQISDPNLVVHEVPHPLQDLTRWQADLVAEMAAQADAASLGAELTVINGQVVIDVFAGDVERAAELAQGVPESAWAWGGGPVRADSP